jgi:hypothetical protein
LEVFRLPRKPASATSIASLFKRFDVEKLNEIIRKIESSSNEYIEIGNYRIDTRQGLQVAEKIKGTLHRELLDPAKHKDTTPFARKLQLKDLRELEIPRLPMPPPPMPWNYKTANQLVSTCPFEQEIKQIRHDFNIYFEKGLIDHGVLKPWSCTNNGKESSIMLSMYNIFRLAKSVPFNKNFPWEPSYGNLYDWLKSLDLTAIGFFWAEQNEPSHAIGKRIYLIGNYLGDPIYREIINQQTGVGIIHALVLLVHEARHAGYNIGHNCGGGTKDTNLSYMGAWAVQYYLLKMLAENTGNFFTNYEQNMLIGSAQSVLSNRFCVQPP